VFLRESFFVIFAAIFEQLHPSRLLLICSSPVRFGGIFKRPFQNTWIKKNTPTQGGGELGRHQI
jgi:hypothetical protein